MATPSTCTCPRRRYSSRASTTARTRVYERTTGLLVPADPNLESQVRQAAEKQITQAALDDKILETARANAKVTITGLLYALGFHKVDVQ